MASIATIRADGKYGAAVRPLPSRLSCLDGTRSGGPLLGAGGGVALSIGDERGAYVELALDYLRASIDFGSARTATYKGLRFGTGLGFFF